MSKAGIKSSRPRSIARLKHCETTLDINHGTNSETVTCEWTINHLGHHGVERFDADSVYYISWPRRRQD